jgi:formiminotetrahydrofolate cyclodeaminase
VIGESVDDFLERLASGSPVPAGGSAAALAAAASAGLVGMVCRVSAPHVADGAALVEAAHEADDLRGRLVRLMHEDALAFKALLEARRGASDRRSDAVREAARRATEVPLDIVESAQRVLGLCERVAPEARPSTVADLGVAVALGCAAFDGATLTVRVNLKGLDDPAFTARTSGTLDRLTGEVTALRHRVTQVIVARTGVSA